MIDLSWGARTHRGRTRNHNEDALLAAAPVFVVADGMGGHEAGEVASEITIEHFRGFVGGASLAIPDIAAAIASANDAIVAAAEAGTGRAGMGTTVVGLIAVEEMGMPYWLAFNIGDSRLYRLWQGELSQISVDHSYVQELVNTGQLTTDNVRGHPERNIVTRALGRHAAIEPDYWVMPPEAGERFLLCSDGLSGDVGHDRILELLLAAGDPVEAASNLVEAALAGGGRDNISVVVVDVRGVGDYGAQETTTPRRAVPHE